LFKPRENIFALRWLGPGEKTRCVAAKLQSIRGGNSNSTHRAAPPPFWAGGVFNNRQRGGRGPNNFLRRLGPAGKKQASAFGAGARPGTSAGKDEKKPMGGDRFFPGPGAPPGFSEKRRFMFFTNFCFTSPGQAKAFRSRVLVFPAGGWPFDRENYAGKGRPGQCAESRKACPEGRGGQQGQGGGYGPTGCGRRVCFCSRAGGKGASIVTLGPGLPWVSCFNPSCGRF